MALAQPQDAQSSAIVDIANQETTNGDDASETLFPPEIEPEELRPEFEESGSLIIDHTPLNSSSSSENGQTLHNQALY